jgi:putative ABC transport system permease protein
LFAVVALGFGLVGVYSVLAYIVGQRHKEIAVRIALGATQVRVMGVVLRRALALTGLAVVLGAGAAWMLTRALANLFVGVSPHDPKVFLGPPLCLFCQPWLPPACRLGARPASILLSRSRRIDG